MKKIIIILLLATTPLFTFAQSKSVKRFYDKYEDSKDAFSLSFSGNFGGSYLTDNINISGDGAKDLEKYFKNFNLVSIKKEHVANIDKAVKELRRAMRAEDFEEFLDIRGKEDHISILVQESKGMVWQLALLVDEDDSFTLLNFLTEISRKEFDRIMEDVDVDFD